MQSHDHRALQHQRTLLSLVGDPSGATVTSQHRGTPNNLTAGATVQLTPFTANGLQNAVNQSGQKRLTGFDTPIVRHHPKTGEELLNNESPIFKKLNQRNGRSEQQREVETNPHQTLKSNQGRFNTESNEVEKNPFLSRFALGGGGNNGIIGSSSRNFDGFEAEGVPSYHLFADRETRDVDIPDMGEDTRVTTTRRGSKESSNESGSHELPKSPVVRAKRASSIGGADTASKLSKGMKAYEYKVENEYKDQYFRVEERKNPSVKPIRSMRTEDSLEYPQDRLQRETSSLHGETGFYQTDAFFKKLDNRENFRFGGEKKKLSKDVAPGSETTSLTEASQVAPQNQSGIQQLIEGNMSTDSLMPQVNRSSPQVLFQEQNRQNNPSNLNHSRNQFDHTTMQFTHYPVQLSQKDGQDGNLTHQMMMQQQQFNAQPFQRTHHLQGGMDKDSVAHNMMNNTHIMNQMRMASPMGGVSSPTEGHMNGMMPQSASISNTSAMVSPQYGPQTGLAQQFGSSPSDLVSSLSGGYTNGQFGQSAYMMGQNGSQAPLFTGGYNIAANSEPMGSMHGMSSHMVGQTAEQQAQHIALQQSRAETNAMTDARLAIASFQGSRDSFHSRGHQGVVADCLRPLSAGFSSNSVAEGQQRKQRSYEQQARDAQQNGDSSRIQQQSGVTAMGVQKYHASAMVNGKQMKQPQKRNSFRMEKMQDNRGNRNRSNKVEQQHQYGGPMAAMRTNQNNNFSLGTSQKDNNLRQLLKMSSPNTSSANDSNRPNSSDNGSRKEQFVLSDQACEELKLLRNTNQEPCLLKLCSTVDSDCLEGNSNQQQQPPPQLGPQPTQKIKEFAQDQVGSRFLQQKVKNGTEQERDLILLNLIPSLPTVVRDPFANFVVQELIDSGDRLGAVKKEMSDFLVETEKVEEEDSKKKKSKKRSPRLQILAKLKGSLLRLSCHQHGCRVVQKLVAPNTATSILKELTGHEVRLCQDAFGNHVIQRLYKALEEVGCSISALNGGHTGGAGSPSTVKVTAKVPITSENQDYDLQKCVQILAPVTIAIIGEVGRIVKDACGCRVVQRAMEFYARAADELEVLHAKQLGVYMAVGSMSGPKPEEKSSAEEDASKEAQVANNHSYCYANMIGETDDNLEDIPDAKNKQLNDSASSPTENVLGNPNDPTDQTSPNDDLPLNVGPGAKKSQKKSSSLINEREFEFVIWLEKENSTL